MVKFFQKNKLSIDILGFLVFVAGSVFDWIDYYEPGSKKMDLIGGIIFGTMAIIKFFDIIEDVKKRKKISI